MTFYRTWYNVYLYGIPRIYTVYRVNRAYRAWGPGRGRAFGGFGRGPNRAGPKGLNHRPVFGPLISGLGPGWGFKGAGPGLGRANGPGPRTARLGPVRLTRLAPT